MTKYQMSIEQETVDLANYLVEKGSTIRDTAKRYGLSKSAVHIRLSKHLQNINFTLFNEVQEVLNRNRDERHIRGGMATKQKYLLVQ